MRKIAQAEEDAKRKNEQEWNGEENEKPEQNQIKVKEMAQDELKLLEEGNKIRQKYSAGVFKDQDFPISKALGDNKDGFGWERVKDLDNDESQPKEIKIFDEGTGACDIK